LELGRRLAALSPEERPRSARRRTWPISSAPRWRRWSKSSYGSSCSTPSTASWARAPSTRAASTRRSSPLGTRTRSPMVARSLLSLRSRVRRGSVRHARAFHPAPRCCSRTASAPSSSMLWIGQVLWTTNAQAHASRRIDNPRAIGDQKPALTRCPLRCQPRVSPRELAWLCHGEESASSSRAHVSTTDEGQPLR
jgi:hypothetical protein